MSARATPYREEGDEATAGNLMRHDATASCRCWERHGWKCLAEGCVDGGKRRGDGGEERAHLLVANKTAERHSTPAHSAHEAARETLSAVAIRIAVSVRVVHGDGLGPGADEGVLPGAAHGCLERAAGGHVGVVACRSRRDQNRRGGRVDFQRATGSVSRWRCAVDGFIK